MKIFVVVASIFAGCAFFSETQNPDILPQVIYRTPLPMVPSDWSDSQPKMEVIIHVSRTGEVITAKFADPSGYDTWETKALEEMKQWRFSPARLGQESVSVWVRLPMTIRFMDQKVMFLAELVCIDRSCADSAYQLLESGYPFEAVVERLPGAANGTYEKTIGETDIRVYSRELQKELGQLKESTYTKPIRIGDSFVIFKRLADKHISGV